MRLALLGLALLITGCASDSAPPTLPQQYQGAWYIAEVMVVGNQSSESIVPELAARRLAEAVPRLIAEVNDDAQGRPATLMLRVGSAQGGSEPGITVRTLLVDQLSGRTIRSFAVHGGHRATTGSGFVRRMVDGLVQRSSSSASNSLSGAANQAVDRIASDFLEDNKIGMRLQAQTRLWLRPVGSSETDVIMLGAFPNADAAETYADRLWRWNPNLFAGVEAEAVPVRRPGGLQSFTIRAVTATPQEALLICNGLAQAGVACGRP